MEALIRRLDNVSDSYFAFVAGVVAYAKETPAHLQKVTASLDDNPDALSSDILHFVMTQSDFVSTPIDAGIA